MIKKQKCSDRFKNQQELEILQFLCFFSETGLSYEAEILRKYFSHRNKQW